MDARTQEFLEEVQAGRQVETGEWLPDEYRKRLIKFIEMQDRKSTRLNSSH